MNIFKKWFSKIKDLPSQPIVEEKNIGNIKLFDDIKIKENDILMEGWVYEKKSNHIDIVYWAKDGSFYYAKFNIERPLDRKEITQNNLTLIIE